MMKKTIITDMQKSDISQALRILCSGGINHIVELFSQGSPKAVETAKKFYKDKYLDYCVQKNMEFRDVFNDIISNVDPTFFTQKGAGIPGKG
ncbi:MAG TPA: hypothetical protein VIL89_05300 [Clostridia bacterium]